MLAEKPTATAKVKRKTASLKATSVVILLALALLIQNTVNAQPPRPSAQIYGRITDLSNNTVAGAYVTVTGGASGLLWVGYSGDDGFYNTGPIIELKGGELLIVYANNNAAEGSVSVENLTGKFLSRVDVQLTDTITGARRHHSIKNTAAVSSSDFKVQDNTLTLKLNAIIANTGDYDEEGLTVTLYNLPSGWRYAPQQVNISRLDRGDKKTVAFELYVPVSSTPPGKYVIGLRTRVKSIIKSELDVEVNVPKVAAAQPTTTMPAEATTTEATTITAESCSDGIRNQDETGVDCGGSCPKPCFREETTVKPSKIAKPSCSDGIQNQGETGIDCGGGPCQPCPVKEEEWGAGKIILIAGVVLIVLAAVVAVLVILMSRRGGGTEGENKGGEQENKPQSS